MLNKSASRVKNSGGPSRATVALLFKYIYNFKTALKNMYMGSEKMRLTVYSNYIDVTVWCITHKLRISMRLLPSQVFSRHASGAWVAGEFSNIQVDQLP